MENTSRERDVNGRDRDDTETLKIFVETRPRRDVDTYRDRLETETSRPRPQPWYQTASSVVLSSLHSCTVYGHQLPVVTHCRDLGVIIANNCQPRLHIHAIVAKASQRANAILRFFKVVILMFCYVPLKFMYDQYWNFTLLSGRLYKRKTSKPSRKYNVGSRRESLD